MIRRVSSMVGTIVGTSFNAFKLSGSPWNSAEASSWQLKTHGRPRLHVEILLPSTWGPPSRPLHTLRLAPSTASGNFGSKYPLISTEDNYSSHHQIAVSGNRNCKFFYGEMIFKPVDSNGFSKIGWDPRLPFISDVQYQWLIINGNHQKWTSSLIPMNYHIFLS